MRDSSTQLRAITNQDGAVILDTKRGMISTLNPTGAFIWQALGRGEELEAIVVSLAREMGEDPNVIKQDVNEFIADLKGQHLLPR